MSYKDLIVWKKSRKLVLEVYKLTDKFPSTEIYSLTSQIRRSAISIPSNIAEGNERNGKKEFRQFLYIALGSCAELDTQIILSLDLSYISKNEYEGINSEIEEIRKMIYGILKTLP